MILNKETWTAQPDTETRNADYSICNEKGCLELFTQFRKNWVVDRVGTCPTLVRRDIESYVKSIRPPYSHDDIEVLKYNE